MVGYRRVPGRDKLCLELISETNKQNPVIVALQVLQVTITNYIPLPVLLLMLLTISDAP